MDPNLVNYMCYDGQRITSTGNSPNPSWDDYTTMDPYLREVMRSQITPKAFIELHYAPSTFGNIFQLISTRPETVPIFRQEGNIFVELGKRSHAPYRPILACMQTLLKHNRQTIEANVFHTHSLLHDGFQNMAIVTECRNHLLAPTEKAPERFEALSIFVRHQFGSDVRLTSTTGFFPYMSNRSDALGEIMFCFHHAKRRTLALVTAPIEARKDAINFIRAHGTLHTFDKHCAVCGKTGDLRKCPCKRVRYCCAECQHVDWPEHKAGCNGEVAAP